MVDISHQLQRGLLVLRVATVVLYLVVASALVYVWVQERQTNQALCSLRTVIDQRTQSEASFLISHPHGVLGISAAQLEATLKTSEHSEKALSSLSCPAV